MTEFYNGAIAISKIKFRWEEPYASEAANRQMTTHASGIYRGGSAGPTPTPSQSFRIGPDADGAGLFVDSLFVTWDEANGLSTVVLDQDTVVVDMSARFSGGGGTMPGDETWWVWQEAEYATGVPSTAAYMVTDTTPPDGSNIIAKIEMLSGDATILEARFDRTVKSLPLPTKREDGAYVAGDKWYGVLSGEEAWNIPTSDQKRAMNNAPTAPTASNPFVTQADTMNKYFGEPVVVPQTGLVGVNRVQLSGWYYVGKGDQFEALSYFSLRHYPLFSVPLMDGDYELIYINRIRNSADDADLVPSADADDQGFYQNPWVTIYSAGTPYSFTGAMNILCCRKKQYSTLEQAPVQAFPLASLDLVPHGKESYSGVHSGSPDSLPGSNVEWQLGKLLDLTNERIKTIHPTATSAAPILLWRSNNTTSDASVDENVTSIYWLNSQIAILQGAIFSSATEVTAKNSGNAHVTMCILDNSLDTRGSIYATRGYVDDDTVWEWENLRNWESYSQKPISPSYFNEYDGQIPLWTNENGLLSGQIHYGFYGHDAITNFGIGFTYNCRRNSTTNLWEAGSTTTWAFALEISGQGIRVYFQNTSDHPTWSDSGWAAEYTITDWSGAAIAAFPEIEGDIYDRTNFSLAGKLMVGMNVYAEDAVTWHGRLIGISSGDVDLSMKAESANWNSVSVEAVEEYGAWISGMSNGLVSGPNEDVYHRGRASVTKY